MSQVHTQTILDQLRALIPGVKPVQNVSSSRTKRDTLDEARAKVAKKLRENIAALSGNAETEKVDPVYKRQGDGAYAVGIKYGNRYLTGAIAGGTFVPGVSVEQLPKLLEMFAGQVEQGLYDAAIEKIMQDNVAARNNVKH